MFFGKLPSFGELSKFQYSNHNPAKNILYCSVGPFFDDRNEIYRKIFRAMTITLFTTKHFICFVLFHQSTFNKKCSLCSEFWWMSWALNKRSYVQTIRWLDFEAPWSFQCAGLINLQQRLGLYGHILVCREFYDTLCAPILDNKQKIKVRFVRNRLFQFWTI